MTEENVSEINDMSTGIIQSEEQREKRFKKWSSNQRHVGQYQEVHYVTGVLEGEEKMRQANMFKEIMAKINLNLVKDILHMQKHKQIPSRTSSRKTHINTYSIFTENQT